MVGVQLSFNEKNDPCITNKLRHPKTFQSLTVKTERHRKTFIPYCLCHYQESCITAARIINSFHCCAKTSFSCCLRADVKLLTMMLVTV